VSDPGGRWQAPTAILTGPRTAVPNVEVYTEDPVLAFQRTGEQPAPYATLPLGVEVAIRRRSGSFSEIDLAGGKTGWVRTSSLTGPVSPPPVQGSGNFGTPVPPTVTHPGGTGGVIIPPPDTQNEDIIDLDRLP